MDYERACLTLGLKQGSYMTPNKIKKAYYKKSLQFHPDRLEKEKANEFYNIDNYEKDKLFYKEKFTEIHEAYEFLTDYIYKNTNSADMKKEAKEDKRMFADLWKMDYFTLFMKFIQHIQPNIYSKWDNVFIDSTLKSVFAPYSSKSGGTDNCFTNSNIIFDVFKELDKERAIEIYQVMIENKELFPVLDETLVKIKTIIRKKIQHDNVIVLEPSLHDLMFDNIYKLEFLDKTLYIPLWHDKIFFEINDQDLIVKIKPRLGKNHYLDKYNNLHVIRRRNILDILKEEKLVIDIGGKKYELMGEELKIIPEQTVFLSEEGILKQNKNSIYDNKRRGKIYLHLFL